ncbi:FAD/FMN-containing dehydrogenase [Microbacterium testaceum StLB037]|uniref:FAD/FMN-containing dehydrogenase n=1 Tax=Microbacterium testaceum (strain StLB037) TaxID=979556 RepID=E8N7M0_MICTS|nr:FAD-linked oxidase C-terminal domain-containing protein [Microbacterium testaceum]BAJ74276.1 FAD/FMN-containing dehydrogenase [Microbacterium testaceum StLB037]
MSVPTAIAASTGLSALLDDVRVEAPDIEVRPPSPATAPFGHDAATAPRRGARAYDGPAVAFPATVSEVQRLVRLAARHGVSVVPRGAGSGLSGGAVASTEQLVISTDRLNRIVEVSPADEVAVIEPGVLNAALNEHLAPLGLFYAPDPASWRISTIGGNIATNAGGLRCAKYGVTRESVLALDVVLADGSLVSIGHRSIKGVTGLDLVSLFVGSEGVLGLVVGATVRIRPLPVARRTVTAFFSSTAEGAAAIGAITASRVRPSVVEFLDEPTLVGIDAANDSGLRARGAALLLIELDGFGIDEQTAELATALEAVGARVQVESDADAEVLWELRRSGRRLGEGTWFVGGDVAVPKSRIAEVFAAFPDIEARYGVAVSAVSHAGDGNLHPVITLPIPAGVDPAAVPAVLHEAAEDLVRRALAVGGTVSGEHGIGTVKRELAAEELAERVRIAQLAIKDALDPAGLFNPGKAL